MQELRGESNVKLFGLSQILPGVAGLFYSCLKGIQESSANWIMA